jgi:DNA-binding transcriptional MerR regulator
MLYCGLHIVTDTPIEIPDRAAFRAAEVCEIAQIPPYVLRSWEKEFPGLGAAARPGGPRIYRRSDVEQILRIKQLVFAEGLTLAGVRHRIEGEPPAEEEALIEAAVAPVVVPADVRSGVDEARRELRALLDLLSERPAAGEVRPIPEAATPGQTTAAEVPLLAAAVTAQSAPESPAEHAVEPSDLPLLNGVFDTPPKPRRVRRTTKQAPWGPPSEVE